MHQNWMTGPARVAFLQMAAKNIITLKMCLWCCPFPTFLMRKKECKKVYRLYYFCTQPNMAPVLLYCTFYQNVKWAESHTCERWMEVSDVLASFYPCSWPKKPESQSKAMCRVHVATYRKAFQFTSLLKGLSHSILRFIGCARMKPYIFFQATWCKLDINGKKNPANNNFRNWEN